MIYNACQMRIFDKLAEMDRAVTSAELSEALELSKENYEDLERLLCCLSHLGLMEKITDEDGNSEWVQLTKGRLSKWLHDPVITSI